MISWWAQYAARAAEQDFAIVPLMPGAKVPGFYDGARWHMAKGWQRDYAQPLSPDEIAARDTWPNAGIGLVLGEVIAVDLDLIDPEQWRQVRDLALAHFGATPLEVCGQPPKTKLFYRTDTPFRKIGAGSPIEILGKGQQAVAWGVHPTTRRPYAWSLETPADVSRDDLPMITADQAKAFWHAAMDLIGNQTAFLQPDPAPQNDTPAEVLLHELKSGPQGGHWNTRTWQLVRALKAEGYLDNEILSLAADLTWPGFEVATTRRELQAMLRRTHGYVPPPPEAQTEPVPPPKSRFTIVDAGTMPLVLDEPYLIKGIVPREGFCVLYGVPKAGKTFFALDMAARISSGLGWRSRRVTQGKVAYWTGEGFYGLNRRLHAWKQLNEASLNGLSLLHGPFDVLDDRVRDEFAQTLREQAPDLVIIDTLARIFGGAEENSSKDMGAVVSALDNLRAELKCAIMVVHHAGKDRARGLRGSSALLGAADQIILVDVEEEEDGPPMRHAMVEASRSESTGVRFAFDLVPQHLGVDRDGDPLSVPAVQHTRNGRVIDTL